jgi:Ion transport protein
VLAEYAATIKREDENREEKRESVFRCLDYLLKADPEPTAGFLTALQSLPEWLSERAVVMIVVQNLLNEKISRPFPTAVLMLDFYILVMIVISYSLNVTHSIELRFGSPDNNDAISGPRLVPLYLGAAYFAGREIVQVMSLISLKSFSLWLYDPSNYLNVVFVFIILYWTVRMQTGGGNDDSFRIGAAVCITVIWVKFVAYLRNVMIDFAVFVGGVFYVVRRLAAFLTALCVILIAFAQMFFTVFQQSDYCKDQPYLNASEEVKINGACESLEWPRRAHPATFHVATSYLTTSLSQFFLQIDARCDDSQVRPYCNFWSSFLSVYTMLLGEVDPTTYLGSPVGVFLFVLFMFLVVILLANVLIAIVTDSYKVIQDQRAAIVFWTNRLNFVAEMDGIANGPWKSRMYSALGCGKCVNSSPVSERKVPQFGMELWKQIIDLFEDEVEEGMFSIEFVAYTVLRVIAACFVIPLWILLGLVTVGWLWPPQIREAVFTSSVMKHSSDVEKQNELRKTQVIKLQEEVQNLSHELLQELALDRAQVVQLKSHVAERKLEIANEMRHIKRIVAALFERQSS